jgi:hypothetical protein
MNTNQAVKKVMSNNYKINLKHSNSFISQKSKAIVERLEYLREEIQNERISYGEIIELNNLKKYIDKNDIELLQWCE